MSRTSIFDAPQSQAPIVSLLVVASGLAHVPVASFLTRPGGVVSYTLTSLLPCATSDLQRVAAISAFYFFIVYMVTAGFSLTGVALGNPEGYLNAEPRLGKYSLAGFPHRLTALHDNLLEIFPAFVICAATTLSLSIFGAERELSEKSINYLVLHVFLKTCVYIPAYAAGFGTLRSFTHLLAIASLLGLLVGVAIE
ncbi:hypothetical protein K439DRAFT_830450 [Ramaria rubella]|nr:hypothetical protein K439DRAFT_830450 [Ramaria rubella]